MAHEEALALVNRMQDALAQSARGVANALQDGKISFWEGVMLGGQGAQLGLMVMGILQGVNRELLQDVLYVLEHGDWTLDD